MHLFIFFFIIFITWKWANWRNWKEYHSTILFLPMINLVYNLISFSSEKFLWKMKPDLLPNYAVTELMYTFGVLSCTSFLFISQYPDNKAKVFVHYIKYIFIYSVVEAIFYVTGRIEFKHGWSIWHSIGFYFIMFPAIRIHYKRPVIAYAVFFLVTIFAVWYFKLPVR